MKLKSFTFLPTLYVELCGGTPLSVSARWMKNVATEATQGPNIRGLPCWCHRFKPYQGVWSLWEHCRRGRGNAFTTASYNVVWIYSSIFCLCGVSQRRPPHCLLHSTPPRSTRQSRTASWGGSRAVQSSALLPAEVQRSSDRPLLLWQHGAAAFAAHRLWRSAIFFPVNLQGSHTAPNGVG